MVPKLNYRIVVFPSWYIYNAIKSYRQEAGGLRFSDYFLVTWTTCQWFLIFLSGKNLLFNLVSAHLSIVGFLIGNLYLQLDVSRYSLSDQRFLKSIPVRIIVALGTISFMYFFANLPSITLEGIEEYLGIDIISGSYTWSLYHSIAGYILIFLWFVFVIGNQYKIFDSFPRVDETMWPHKFNRLTKTIMILFYLAIISSFDRFLIGGQLVHFGK